ncbi:MAG: methyltransferase [Bacteroides sp.]
MIKRFMYGTLPYVACLLFKRDSVNLTYYRYIHRHGYRNHLYEFREEYEAMRVEVQQDAERNLPYVINRQGRRLYFKRGTPVDKIERMYRALVMEQDPRSPHHYLDCTDEAKGYTWVDAGCAEGYTSLEVVEEAGHLYLFECDEAWIEALEATFVPWREKVTIVRRWVGSSDDDMGVCLDSYFRTIDAPRLFLKMDIEGAEPKALQGCKELFATRNVRFAICTYHHNDEQTIPPLLKKYGCRFVGQTGYFRRKKRIVVVRGDNGKRQ